MQRIERYGVIALVFLLVTILAVSIWGEGQAQDVLANVKDRASGMLGGVAVADAQPVPSTKLTPGGRRATKRSLPMGGQDAATPRKRNGRKGGLRRDETLEDAFVTLEPQRKSKPVPTPNSRVVVPARPTTVAAQPKPAVAHKRDERAAAPASNRTYKVRAGDTMGEIAQRELGTYKRWNEIQRINGGLDPAKLRVGMEIKLPGGARAAKAPAETTKQRVAAATPKASGARYSVRKGDSLSAISQRELGTASRWKEIAALNPKVDPNRLAVGAKLVMPAGLRLPQLNTQQVAAVTSNERNSGAGRVR